MLHNAGSLASRFRRHGGIDSFVRAVMSMDNLAAALVCSMIPKLQQMEASCTREYYSPGQRGDWGLIMYLLSGWGEFQGRDGGKCARNCPFIESFPFLSDCVGP